MAHARLSASAAHRWMACPGSINAIRDLEDTGAIGSDTSSDAAMEGTAAHYIGELCLRELIAGAWDISAAKYIGRRVIVEQEGDGCAILQVDPIPDGWRSYVVDEDMAGAVDVFIQHVLMVLRSMGATDKGLPPGLNVEVEAYADLSHLGREDLGGRIDVRITDMLGDMHVIDYKHGRGIPVSPEHNEQLMIYGLGGDVNKRYGPDNVVLTIVQPRCPKNDPVDSWEISASDLRDWGSNVLLPAAELTEAKDAPRTPGGAQCHWCRAAGHCDTAHAETLEVAKIDFDEPPNIANIDMDKVLRILEVKDLVEGMIKAATARVMHELEAGRDVPGWKLVRGQSRRKWKAEAEATLKSKRIPQTVTHEKKLISFTKLEKAKGGKYKELVAELTEKPEGAPILAKASDKRPSLTPVIGADFDDPILI